LPDSGFRKLPLRCFKFLEACDIRLGFREPAQEHWESAIDAVHVEGSYLHKPCLNKSALFRVD
jgi:hypothetical protein